MALTVNGKIFDSIGKKHGVHPSIVRSICTYPFLFAKKVIEDPNDYTPLMFAYLFKIKLKRRFSEDKSKTYQKYYKNYTEE